jgi:hypothetical protein
MEGIFVKGFLPRTQAPASSWILLQWCSRFDLPAARDGEWLLRVPRDTAIDGRLRDWYLRWLKWAVIPTDARLSLKFLESLSHCATLVVLVVAERGRRAYREAKADTRGTVVTSGFKVFGRARFPGFADVVLLGRSYGL